LLPTVFSPPERQVRALYTERTITVYQAYPDEFAEASLAEGRFPRPFTRKTWINPSFLRMMYRSGWATKRDRERVLAVQITREGFEWALRHSALTSYEPGTYASPEEWAERRQENPVEITWDPERSVTLAPLPWRAIQLGLSREAVTRYARTWITGLTDVTAIAHQLRDLVAAGEHEAAQDVLPAELPYELPGELRHRIGVR
jgi:hypothetical protein